MIRLLSGRIPPAEIENTRDPWTNPYPAWSAYRPWPDRPADRPILGNTWSTTNTPAYAGGPIQPSYTIRELFGPRRPRDPGLRSYTTNPRNPGWGNPGWAYGEGKGWSPPPRIRGLWSDIPGRPRPDPADWFPNYDLHPYYPFKVPPARIRG